MKREKFFIILLLLCASLSFVSRVRADYVLPYPSYMPGNKLYTISRIFDYVRKWWYWGGVASFKYHIGLSDKDLVEAKTLFEYKQYALGVAALKRSDAEFQQLPFLITKVESEGVDTTTLRRTASEAASVHNEVLSKLIIDLPEQFLWSPEKTEPTLLPLRQLLTTSRELRNSVQKTIK